MECRDAQFYLRLRRHTGDELGPDASAALEDHLAGCPVCAADARVGASFDRAMASAMRAVSVPSGLRERLLTQAAVKQGTILRRKMYRVGAMVAAGLLLVAVGLGVFSTVRPRLDTDELVRIGDDQMNNPEESTRRWLTKQELPDRLPIDNFDYDLLAFHGFERVNGKYVPVIVFRSPEGSGFAKVYIFRHDGDFDRKDIRDAQASHTGAQVVIGQNQFRGFTYVFLHTGRDLTPFLRTRKAAIQA